VWILDGQFVHPVHVRTGITDNINTQIVEGDLKEGQAVVIGDALAGGSDTSNDDAKNPFAPQFRRGGRNSSSSGSGGTSSGGGRK
jgi:hypothetical protein